MQSVYIEAETGLTQTTSDDAGEANYTITNSSGVDVEFSLVSTSGSPEIYATLWGISTMNNPEGSVLSIGFQEDSWVPFILVGDDEGFAGNNPPEDWMQANIQYLGCQSLRQLCIPGSHDAGMSQFNAHTALADSENTLTQTLGIGDQLAAGVRYFDIRPVISGGAFWTGHYSNTSTIVGWQGADGQSIQSVINDVNSFTASNQELVVLYLSHTANTDTNYSPFDDDEWNNLLYEFYEGLNFLFQYDPSVPDITTLPLSTFIQSSAAVVVVVSESFDLNAYHYAGRGFFNQSQFPQTGSYTDTDNMDVMREDQYEKLLSDRTSPDDEVFQVFWTQTLTGAEDADAFDSIISRATYIYSHLFETGTAPYTGPLLWTSSNTYPNIILIDNVQQDRFLTSLAIGISRYYSSC